MQRSTTGDLEGTELTIDSSEHGHFPEGMTLRVERDHTNQFTGRRTITVTFDGDAVPNRVGHAQLTYESADSQWTEIHAGLAREHESVTFEEL